ncbi:hypothetical protein A2U01_0106868, partial [Trifolium medium]|nr:hypothetical protein [Trifolium medium]
MLMMMFVLGYGCFHGLTWVNVDFEYDLAVVRGWNLFLVLVAERG